MIMMKNKQCGSCEYADTNSTGIYCSLIMPPPEFENGECSKYVEDVRIPYVEEN